MPGPKPRTTTTVRLSPEERAAVERYAQSVDLGICTALRVLVLRGLDAGPPTGRQLARALTRAPRTDMKRLRREGASSLTGKYGDVPTSSDDFAGRKEGGDD